MHFKLSLKHATFVKRLIFRVMTKEEYVSIALSHYEELDSLKNTGNFYEYEKKFAQIWQDLGREYLESALNEKSATIDRRKKKH